MSRTPLSAAISSASGLGRRSSAPAASFSALTRSRSRLPIPIVHDFKRDEYAPEPSPSGFVPCSTFRRFFDGLSGPSGGGVGGA